MDFVQLQYSYNTTINYTIESPLISASRTVTMNLAFNITDVNDGISRGSDYISSERNGTVLAIVSSSKTFSTSNHSYSATQYLLRMNQSLENRFLLVVAAGTNQTVRENLAALGGRKIPGKTFGVYSEPSVGQFPLFLRLQYEDINILNRIRFVGSTKLIIRNEGKEDGLTKIAFEVV